MDSLYAYLEEEDNENDWPTYQILADYFDDIGQYYKADALRWMVKNAKRPWRCYISKGKYHWYKDDNRNKVDPSSDLPEKIYLLLEAPGDSDNELTPYETLIDAHEDFYQAHRRAYEKSS